MSCLNFQRLYEKMRKKLTEYGSEEEPLSVKCIYCSRRERLVTFHKLSKGNHIQLKGEKFRVNVGNKQLAPYTHHAIAKDIKILKKSEAELTLIEFISTPYDSNLKIRETRSIKTLKNEDIYIIKYAYKTHSAEEIVRRAETFVVQCQESQPDMKYNLFTCNCEHFCHWCCTGNEDSYQVHNFKDTVKNILTGSANIAGKILRVGLKVAFISADDLSKALAGTLLYLPWGVVSVLAIIYLVYCIHSHIKLTDEKTMGNICASCCSHLKQDLWLRFLIYVSTQVGGLALVTLVTSVFSSTGIAVGGLALISILTLGSMWLIPRLKNALCSPFKGKKVQVRSMQEVSNGDVVSFRYQGFMHDAVITETFPNKTDDKKGKLWVVHYSKPSIFGRRKIVEEELDIDLTENTLLGHVYDPKSYNCHEPKIVVKRARMRKGETKFGLVSNRSCHFCHWAKVIEGDPETDVPDKQECLEFVFTRELSPLESFSKLESLHVDHRIGRPHATKTLGREWAKIRDDIKQGQLIEFKLYWRWHKAVVTNVDFNTDSVSKLAVMVVHYGERKEVTEDTYIFDLREVDVWIYKYHPLYRFNKEDVVRRARARIGERKYNMFSHNSSHLSKEIVEKARDTVVTDFEEVHPGDAIVFYYWSLKHAGIVTRVILDESKDNRSARLGVVHYALPHLFAKRTIAEEDLTMNLNIDHVYKMNFDGCVKYTTQRIVKNARDRIGETRFSVFGNTSWDLVQWAVVVQSPAIVDEVLYRDPGSGNDEQPEARRQRLLLPKVVNPSGEFQKVTAYTWNEINPGDIIEFTSMYYWFNHQGIVSESNETENTIKVIHYGASHIFAVRTVMEDVLHINLQTQGLAVYQTDPRNCYKKDDIVERAKKRLGEQDWRPGNLSWDLCLACVLKKK